MHPRFEDIQRQSTIGQNRIMESTNVEPFPQCLFRVCTELFDFEFPNLVCQRLSGPDNIPIDLNNDIMLSLGRPECRFTVAFQTLRQAVLKVAV